MKHILNFLLKKTGLVVIEKETLKAYESCYVRDVRVSEVHRYLSRLDFALKPMWDYIGGKGGVDFSPHRDAIEKSVFRDNSKRD